MQIVEPTNSQLMNVLDRIENKLIVHDQKFESIDQRFDEMEQNHFGLVDFLQEHMVTKEELNEALGSQDSRFDRKLGKLNHDLRDYIDRKIYDLRGDLVQIGVLKRI